MVVTCDILFDKNPNCTFISGQVVNGTIILKSDKRREVKAILLKISGSADTYWTEKTFDKTDSYWGQENYLDSVIYLLGSEDVKQCTLEAGTHQYTFSFQLPLECPTSLESWNGRIRYICKVVLVRPWKFDQTFTKAFSVIKELDLNREGLELGKPLHANAEKSLWSLTESNPFFLAVTLAKNGFVSGENIPIELLLTNESSVAIKETRMSLYMTIICYERASHVSSTTQYKVVSELRGEGMQSYCKKLFKYELPVPATPPTSITDCTIIEITYIVKVELIFKGLHTSLDVSLPITIGTVPIMRTEKKKEEMEINVENAASTSKTSSSNFEAPRVNYKEALHLPPGRINAGEDHDYGQKDFSPNYPVFDMLENLCCMETNDKK